MQALTRRADLRHLLGVNQFFTDLAGYARTHPGAGLHRWWATARCLQAGAFAADPDDLRQLAYRAPIRPDAHGVFTDNHPDNPDDPDDPGEPGELEKAGLATVPFFLEHDTGSERLAVLVPRAGSGLRRRGHRCR